ncbi:alpha/beta fold hydrolase [Brevibacillus sp. GCM10020057]|uniref:alpha/beta fold hydrolase n=1 Tax=Brevibacillus sp. GCM10020057 TaxID=3317327 RepID=UPI0036282751
MPYTQAGSLSIHYRTQGVGTPLILLHGLGNNSQSWSRQLAGLQDQFQVIAWDAPGYGDSSDPDPEFRTFGELADILEDFIDSLGFEKIFLLGHSMGSTTAMEFCAKYPERVQALILAASTRGGRTNPETNERKLKDRLHNVENLSPQELAELRIPAMFSPYAAPEAIAEAKRIMAMVRPPGYRSVAYSLYNADTTGLLPSLKMPTLLICGEDDKVTPVAESRIVEQGIAGSTLKLIARAGHLCYIEQPEEFNSLVRSFLQGCDKEGAR